jgi:hypothetical protein
MKRITKGDIKFQLNPRLIYIDDFTIKFYTVNKDYCLTRNQSNVDVEGESGDTKYYIDLDWSELQIIGEGVLQYIATNNIEDVHFLDHEYNKTVERSTQYFINSGIYIDEEEFDYDSEEDDDWEDDDWDDSEDDLEEDDWEEDDDLLEDEEPNSPIMVFKR